MTPSWPFDPPLSPSKNATHGGDSGSSVWRGGLPTHCLVDGVLPVPGGVPLRGLAYFVGAIVLVVLVGRLPLVGDLLHGLSAPLRLVILPLGIAVLASQAAPDGRAAHRYLATWLGLKLRARRRSAGRAVALEGEAVAWQGDLPLRPDASGPALRRARICGPARLRFAAPAAVSTRGRTPHVRPATGSPGEETVSALELAPGERVEVRP